MSSARFRAAGAFRAAACRRTGGKESNLSSKGMGSLWETTKSWPKWIKPESTEMSGSAHSQKAWSVLDMTCPVIVNPKSQAPKPDVSRPPRIELADPDGMRSKPMTVSTNGF